MSENNPKKETPQKNEAPSANRSVSRGAAIRASKRNMDDAHRALKQYMPSVPPEGTAAARGRANVVTDESDKLKITYLGGQEEIGEKNMQVIEWKNQAIILDCGIYLGVDLPGVNYTINDTTYLEKIKNKIKGYVISHGHLDHLGGLKHIVPRFPAPIYGTLFTNGVIQKSFEEMPSDGDTTYVPQLVTMNMDNHERLMIGEFTIELVRITH